MKIKGVLTCGPSIEIVKLPYVVVKAAGKKVENSVFGRQCSLPPLSPLSYPKLVATESFFLCGSENGGHLCPAGTMDRYQTNICVLIF